MRETSECIFPYDIITSGPPIKTRVREVLKEEVGGYVYVVEDWVTFQKASYRYHPYHSLIDSKPRPPDVWWTYDPCDYWRTRATYIEKSRAVDLARRIAQGAEIKETDVIAEFCGHNRVS